MTPDPDHDRLLSLMRRYVSLADQLPRAQSLEELKNLLEQLDDLEDGINQLAEEPEVRVH